MTNAKLFIAVIFMMLSGCKTIPTTTVQKIKGENMLQGKRVAILVTDGFEQVELTEPKKALEDAGAEVIIVSPKADKVQGFHHDKAGDKISVDVVLHRANAKDFHALLLPGGVKNPDQLRLVPDAIAFIKAFGKQGKPIAAICHGPWTLIDAHLVKGHTVTSWPSLANDLRNAGATWVDQEVVVSKNLVTSRKPEDIPAFNRAMIRAFADEPTKK